VSQPPEDILAKPGYRFAEAMVEAARAEAANLPGDWQQMEVHVKVVNLDGRPEASWDYYALRGEHYDETGASGGRVGRRDE
jgi:hypothetical protein